MVNLATAPQVQVFGSKTYVIRHSIFLAGFAPLDQLCPPGLKLASERLRKVGSPCVGP